MNAVMVCITLAALGIDVGWQPLPGGGMEYVIQIAPQTLELLKSGELIQSDVPAEVRDIRAYRIMVGTGKLPRELPPAAKSGPDAPWSPPKASTVEPSSPGTPSPAPPPGPQQTGTPSAPRTLPAEPAGKPISAESATFVEQGGGPQQNGIQPAGASQPPTEPTRPWMVLMLVVLGLFASLGGNVYLGWITWDIHRRYRVLLRQPSQAASADSSSS